jgi:hypothetical protein
MKRAAYAARFLFSRPLVIFEVHHAIACLSRQLALKCPDNGFM